MKIVILHLYFMQTGFISFDRSLDGFLKLLDPMGHFAINFGNVGKPVILKVGQAAFPRVKETV